MSLGNHSSTCDHDSEALDEYSTAPSTSSESSRFYEDSPLQGQADKFLDREPSKHTDFQQFFYFLTFTLKESTLQTVYIFVQSLWCTWLLLRQLPKPLIDAVRALTPLWLCVIHAISLVVVALVQKLAVDILRRAHCFLVKTRELWTDLDVLLAFPRLASHSGVALSSPAPSALSNTTSFQCPSTRTVQSPPSTRPLRSLSLPAPSVD